MCATLKKQQTIRRIETNNSDSLDIIIGEFVFRHGKRNAVSSFADLLKVNWIFHCAYWNTRRGILVNSQTIRVKELLLYSLAIF